MATLLSNVVYWVQNSTQIWSIYFQSAGPWWARLACNQEVMSLNPAVTKKNFFGEPPVLKLTCARKNHWKNEAKYSLSHAAYIKVFWYIVRGWKTSIVLLMMANRSGSLWYWKAREGQFFTKNHVGWVERRNQGDCHRDDADGPPAHQELLIVAAVLERVVEADQEGDEDEQAEDDVVHRWEGGAQHLETSGTGETSTWATGCQHNLHFRTIL